MFRNYPSHTTAGTLIKILEESLRWLCNTEFLVSAAVFMQNSFGSIQGFSSPVGLQLVWLEWCGARGLSTSYFTRVLWEITELTSLWLCLSHSTRCQPLWLFSPHFFFSLIIFLFCLSVSYLLSPLLIPLLPRFSLLFPIFLFMLFSKLTDLNKLPGLSWIIDYGADIPRRI